MGEEEVGVGEQLSGRAGGEHFPLVHEEGCVADFEDHLEVVAGNELGDGEGLEQADESAARLGVEVGGGLVEREDFGPHGEHSGDADAAALSVTEVMRRAVGGVCHFHLAEGLSRPGLGFLRRQVLVEGSEGDVVEHAKGEELVVGVLEYEADLVPQRLEGGGREDLPEHAEGALAAEDAVEVQEEG